jgi:hypothetical protein
MAGILRIEVSPVEGFASRIRGPRRSGVGGQFVANRETDEADWLPVELAIERATYPNVRALLAEEAGRHS